MEYTEHIVDAADTRHASVSIAPDSNEAVVARRSPTIPALEFLVRPVDFRTDLGAVRALHALLLEVQYDESFYNQLKSQQGRNVGQTFIAVVPYPTTAPTGATHDRQLPDGTAIGIITIRIDSEDDDVNAVTAAWRRGYWVVLDWIVHLASHLGITPPAPTQPINGYIMTFAVMPEFRGRGVGSALLTTAEGELRSRHSAAMIKLHCLTTNETAQRLYTRHGFVVTERIPAYYNFNGKSHDSYLLCKSLEDATVETV